MASIVLDNVCVDFPIYDSDRSLRKLLFQAKVGGIVRHDQFRRNRVTIRALENLSFELHDGDRLGLIGHNGAGKSTLLRVMSGGYRPSSGTIGVAGEVASLLTLGVGFDVEDTGFENIYTGCLYLGMTPSQIREKTDEIAEFTELGEYLKMPVRTYSSGMQVRLSFAIATALDPDILLLDEVLAVGDAAFQAKCLGRIAELRKDGRTIVFISHDLAAVHRLCDRAILLSHGSILSDGPARQVIDEYQQITFADQGLASEPDLQTQKPAQCTSIAFSSPDPSDGIRTGHPLISKFGYRATEDIPDAVFRVSIYWPSGYLCAQLTTESTTGGIPLQRGSGIVEFQCPALPVVPGLYRIDLLIESKGLEVDLRQRCATLRVEPGNIAYGDFYIENTWKITESRAH